MTILVISPSIAKESAQALSEALAAEYMNPYETKRRKFLKHDIVVNYGFSRDIVGNKIINTSKAVNIARDKIECFTRLKNVVPTVLMTTEREAAEKWIRSGRIVVARDRVKGDNGKGLTYCSTLKELVACTEAKFFTRYIHHTNEYRVNVWRGKVLSVYDKIRKAEHFKFNLLKGQDNHPQLAMFAEAVHKATELDWFGMDLIRTEKGTLFFLEVNSAPVLFPHTTAKLVKNILEI